MTARDDASDETVTVAIMTTILYAARFQRRVPESDAEKRRTIADAVTDARTILEVLTENESAPKVAAPTQPLPSPGIIGRADVKAARRRG